MTRREEVVTDRREAIKKRYILGDDEIARIARNTRNTRNAEKLEVIPGMTSIHLSTNNGKTGNKVSTKCEESSFWDGTRQLRAENPARSKATADRNHCRCWPQDTIKTLSG